MFAFFALGAAFVTAIFAGGCGDDSESAPPVPAEPPPSETESANPTPGESPSFAAPLTSETPHASGPCPPNSVLIDKFCIDSYEARLSVDGRMHPFNHRPPGGKTILAVSEPNEFPQAYISRNEAAEACHNAGKRLCTMKEWLRACRGAPQWIYPYGPNEEKGKCNVSKPHLLLKFFEGIDPKSYSYDGHFNSPLLNEVPGFLARTGEYAACRGMEMVFDMVGNLHEWIADNVDRDLMAKLRLNPRLEKRIKDNLGNGIFMGGFYSTSNEHGSGCEFLTMGHEAAYHDYSTGFRCCSEPKAPGAQGKVL